MFLLGLMAVGHEEEDVNKFVLANVRFEYELGFSQFRPLFALIVHFIVNILSFVLPELNVITIEIGIN